MIFDIDEYWFIIISFKLKSIILVIKFKNYQTNYYGFFIPKKTSLVKIPAYLL